MTSQDAQKRGASEHVEEKDGCELIGPESVGNDIRHTAKDDSNEV